MIPQEKSAAVARGLREAFGVTEIDDIRVMTKGHTSAVVLRIVLQGSAYLLRIIMRPNVVISPERLVTCMTAAAEAGLAPRVWYVSVEDGISITDFVEEVAFPASEARRRMPAVLRALHALPPFPGVERHFNTTCTFLLNKGPAVEGLLQKFQAAKIVPEDESEELLARLAQVAAVYPWDEAELVSSHNDLFKPDNILFDGQRVWLVDWEAAFLNDRYADLAVVANLVVEGEAEERAFLEGYFGQAPDEYQVARFFLMRQIAHVFYTVVFLLQGSVGGPVDDPVDAPNAEDMQRRFWAGEIRLEDSQTKAAYGRFHLEWLLEETRQARFGEALRIVSDGHLLIA